MLFFFFFFFFFQAEDGIRDVDWRLEFRRVLFRSSSEDCADLGTYRISKVTGALMRFRCRRVCGLSKAVDFRWVTAPGNKPIWNPIGFSMQHKGWADGHARCYRDSGYAFHSRLTFALLMSV